MTAEPDRRLTKAEREFLIAVRDDTSIWPLLKKLGYGWAIERGFIFRKAPAPYLDFGITDAGLAALARSEEK